MEAIFNHLYTALYGNVALAVVGSFLWGLASVILSPCHLSGIPLIVSVMIGKRSLSLKQTFVLSTIFAVGILVSIALIGLVTALLGRMMGDLGSHANLIFGIALCLGGIMLLDIIPLGNISLISRLHVNGSQPETVFVVGLLFGLALGPCSFAFMAPVLAVVFSMAESRLWEAIGLMLAYGLGHSIVIIIAGTSVGLVQKILNWNNSSQGLMILKRICAGLVILDGIYMILK